MSTGTRIAALAVTGLLAAAGLPPPPIRMDHKAPQLDGKDWINSSPVRLKDRRGLLLSSTFGHTNASIEYPVLADPGLVNWRRWNQQFWPTVYLIDRKGRIRYRWEGEMNYANLDGERTMTTLIEQLLEETP